jgi:hypothetical protein
LNRLQRDGDPRSPEVIERDVEAIRAELDRVASELDRRRHEMTDLRLQMRRHPRAFALAAIVGTAAISGLVALAVRKRRRAHRPASKMQRLRTAVARMIDRPEAVAKESPNATKKIAAAAASAVAAALGKRLAQRMISPHARAGGYRA